MTPIVEMENMRAREGFREKHTQNRSNGSGSDGRLLGKES